MKLVPIMLIIFLIAVIPVSVLSVNKYGCFFTGISERGLNQWDCRKPQPQLTEVGIEHIQFGKRESYFEFEFELANISISDCSEYNMSFVNNTEMCHNETTTKEVCGGK